MRPLTEEEAKLVFEKLLKYVGANLSKLTDRGGEAYCFRLHNDRVFYARESLVRSAVNIPRSDLVGVGTCIGKLTHSKKFHLTVGAVDLLAENAVYKIWIKPSAEQQFLYGHHVLKSGVGRITENMPVNAGMVIYSMADVPLGFAVSVDVGDYIRDEEHII